MTVLVRSASNSMTNSARAGTSRSTVLALHQLDRRAAQAARQLEVVGLLGHLDRRGIGQDRIDADHHRRAIGGVAERPRLGHVLAEAGAAAARLNDIVVLSMISKR